MRESCGNCTIKHLAQASILLEEARHGYPLHQYLAWGHMAEAASEIEMWSMVLADKIRQERKQLQETGLDYRIDYLGLIEQTLKGQNVNI